MNGKCAKCGLPLTVGNTKKITWGKRVRKVHRCCPENPPMNHAQNEPEFPAMKSPKPAPLSAPKTAHFLTTDIKLAKRLSEPRYRLFIDRATYRTLNLRAARKVVAPDRFVIHQILDIDLPDREPEAFADYIELTIEEK